MCHALSHPTSPQVGLQLFVPSIRSNPTKCLPFVRVANLLLWFRLQRGAMDKGGGGIQLLLVSCRHCRGLVNKELLALSASPAASDSSLLYIRILTFLHFPCCVMPKSQKGRDGFVLSGFWINMSLSPFDIINNICTISTNENRGRREREEETTTFTLGWRVGGGDRGRSRTFGGGQSVLVLLLVM